MSDLARRLQRLEDLADLHALKARYTACADAKYTPARQLAPGAALRAAAQGQADCFTPDAMWEAGDGFGGHITGRAALAEWFARPPWRFALHLYAAPEFTLEEDRAQGLWRLWQVATPAQGDEAVLLLGITHETYRRMPDGQWLISGMRFEQTHIAPLGAEARAALAPALPHES
ncbi:nuclear transport factor 2 family protein [Novosphingobium rosa]|uniref:nuclear transport factor 2 family protein n=1 Tax=Novosphingobium rosa TaxID=76978 RepID=UPI00082DA00D|nr:nuclear transport factor 2 family protein [Novosphingobium rosa]